MIRNTIAAVICSCLVLVTWSVWRQLDQPIRSVRVEGHLSASEQAAIREVVSHTLEGGVLSLNAEDVRTSIHDLSWPRAVEVRRVWPHTLIIRVEKESVVAAWGDGGYLTSAGKVVRLAEGDLDVPHLATSLSPPRRAMEVYQMLASRVSAAGFTITRLEENGLGEWVLTFGRGIRLSLGNESLTERLDRFLLTYYKALAPRVEQIEHVDLRYDSGLAVAWKEAPAGETAPGEKQQAEMDYALR